MAQKKKDIIDLWLEKNTVMFSPVIRFENEDCDHLCRVCTKQDCPIRALPTRPDLLTKK